MCSLIVVVCRASLLFVVCCLWFAAWRCLLFVVCYVMRVVCWSLYVARCVLCVVSLCVVCSLLFIDCCSLFVVRWLLLVVCWSLFVV